MEPTNYTNIKKEDIEKIIKESLDMSEKRVIVACTGKGGAIDYLCALREGFKTEQELIDYRKHLEETMPEGCYQIGG